VATVTVATAPPLFSSPLQTASDLSSQWQEINGYTGATIAMAPDGTNALTFTQKASGGDALTLSTFSSTTGSFTLSFDIFGYCGYTSGCGAFVYAPGGSPNNGYWIESDTPYGGTAYPNGTAIPNFTVVDQRWERVTYTFTGSSTQIGFEDWSGSPYATPRSFYIRNVVLTNNPTHIAVGTLTISPY
jgi:hypothetical protein